jgi:hypothetical protein
VSWSGERAKAVAAALRDFIKRVVQASDPWMSARDIEAGLNWSKEIAAELASAVVGVVVVTPENRERPWLNFEAGAISKEVGGPTFTCPYLFDLDEATLAGPLGQFQAVKADRDGTWSLLQMINRAVGTPLRDGELADTFEAFWPKLSATLAAIGPADTMPAPRPPGEMLEELLGLAREISRNALTPADVVEAIQTERWTSPALAPRAGKLATPRRVVAGRAPVKSRPASSEFFDNPPAPAPTPEEVFNEADIPW